jgi:neurofibromin 1
VSCSGKITDSVQNGRRIFYYIVSRVALVDYDLLAYHVFQVSSAMPFWSLLMANQVLERITDFFDIVIDLTDFSPATELPMNWLRRSLQMCPPGILPCVNVSSSFCVCVLALTRQTLALYNPNSYAKKRLRRLISELLISC